MPTISDQELQRINNVLKKALESEKRNQQLLEKLGPAIVSVLDPILHEMTDKVGEISHQVETAISRIKIESPVVNVPESKAPIVNYTPPTVNVPKPQVTVNVPDVHVPEIKLPDIKIPTVKVPKSSFTVKIPKGSDKGTIKELKGIQRAISTQQTAIERMVAPEYSMKKPMPVLITDLMGKPASLGGGGGRVAVPRKGLHLDEYDYVSLTESAIEDVYVFKKGGSSGSAVGGITIVYVDDTKNTISTVTRH